MTSDAHVFTSTGTGMGGGMHFPKCSCGWSANGKHGQSPREAELMWNQHMVGVLHADLAAQTEELRKSLATISKQAAERDALRAERDRLREALREIAADLTESGAADNHTFPMCPGPDVDAIDGLTCAPCYAAIIARNALGGPTDGE